MSHFVATTEKGTEEAHLREKEAEKALVSPVQITSIGMATPLMHPDTPAHPGTQWAPRILVHLQDQFKLGQSLRKLPQVGGCICCCPSSNFIRLSQRLFVKRWQVWDMVDNTKIHSWTTSELMSDHETGKTLADWRSDVFHVFF